MIGYPKTPPRTRIKSWDACMFSSNCDAESPRAYHKTKIRRSCMNIIHSIKPVFAVGILSALLAVPAAAQYKEIAVTNGGSISGVVKAKGKAPADEMKE